MGQWYIIDKIAGISMILTNGNNCRTENCHQENILYDASNHVHVFSVTYLYEKSEWRILFPKWN